MAALKPATDNAAISDRDAGTFARSGGPETAGERVIDVHDYVGEMVVGTWLTFTRGSDKVDQRLTYVSPMRTKYVFTGRYHSDAMVITPEELAYELGSGRAHVLVEPVPLWDRAISVALETLAARLKPGSNSSADAASAAS
jgi:hypothetical protein